MSTTDLAPSFQCLVQQTAGALGESLEWVEEEIQDLEQKSEGAKGNVQDHYQEILKELWHTKETLEKELASLGTEVIPRTLTLSIPSVQDLLGLEATAIPVEPKTSSVYHLGCLEVLPHKKGHDWG